MSISKQHDGPGLGSGALREALAQCKESLDAIWAAIGDALLSGRGLNSTYANKVAAEARTASDAAREALSLSSPTEPRRKSLPPLKEQAGNERQI